MRPFFSALLLSLLFLPTRAEAQIAGSWGGANPMSYMGGLSSGDNVAALDGLRVSGGRDYWSRCIGGDDISRERSITSCGRVIGERASRVITAAAYYYRAKHYETLGDGEHMQRDYERALELFTQEARAHRNDPIAFYNRAGVLSHFQEFDRSISDYRQAALLRPQWDEPHYRMGGIAFQRGDYSTAITEFDRAAELETTDPYNHSARCEARAAAGTDFAGAEAACAEALRLVENDSYVLVSRGYLRFMQGDINAAHADFVAALEADGDNLYAAYGRGVTGTRLGHGQQADADLARAAEGLSGRERAYYANAGLRP